MVATAAYAGAGEAWAIDAADVYRPLGEHLLDRCGRPLSDLVALDAGAGTGFVSATLEARGARRIVAIDCDLSMLHHQRRSRPPSVVGDVLALPFRRRCFDVAVASFVLNHVAAPDTGLGELRRVTRDGGIVLASTFALHRDPAKEAFDEVASRYGWAPPEFSVEMHRRQDSIGTPVRLAAAAEAAGLRGIDVEERRVATAITDPERFGRYRLALPQYSEWFGCLGGDERSTFRDAAAESVSGLLPFAPVVVTLVARP